jgi:hypothetical protein
MTASDWARVRDLVERALDQNESDVAAFLDREAGADAPLRAEVISLLENHRQAGAFLSEPAEIDPEAFDDPPLEPGRVIGPYTIVREAGRGGMGRVYVATDARLGRTVALKAVRAQLTDSAQRERLRREARAAAALTHPGICTVYALEEFEGDLFIASELIEGRTLRQEMASGGPSAPVALQTAREIAAALSAAHTAGVTHGDLKPENVMRAYDGRLKILDFGLARLEPASPDLQTIRDTGAGPIAGTPGYMAPEQLNGRPRDPRADVFAFGVLMYEFASGTHPFEASTPLGIAARVLESDALPIAAVRPDLPQPLAAVIERCMRKAAADRFSSAAGIVQALSLDSKPLPRARVATWWRAHQLIVVGLYSVASIAAWQIKELHAGSTTAVFLLVGIAATVAAVFRGHLLFTERVNGAGLTAERRRAAPVTLAVDLLIAAGLAVDGAIMASSDPLPAVLTLALSVGLVLARLVVEPSTTAAAFDNTPPAGSAL